MNVIPDLHMSVDQYLSWAEEHPGRYELVDGIVHVMTPERAIHAEIKGTVYMALSAGIRARNLPCRAMPDGMTVRIDERTAYEPDALVYCGERLSPSALEVSEPVIVVEVLSPSTGQVDLSRKLVDYFRVSSVAHYLIFDPDHSLIIHHARAADDKITTRIVREGTIELDPPGVTLDLSDIY